MSNYSKQATRPITPRPVLQTAGERQANPYSQQPRATARVNPMRVNIQDGRGTGYIGNLDEMLERERQRHKGGTLDPAPVVKPVLAQEPGMQNIINQDNRRSSQRHGGGCAPSGLL